MERRPRLPPCFPTSRARANSSPASRPIVEGLTRAEELRAAVGDLNAELEAIAADIELPPMEVLEPEID